jgi:predicted porin
MKKSLLALAALGTFAGVAHAQSSVTLYGIVDAGFVYNNNSAGSKLYSKRAPATCKAIVGACVARKIWAVA